MGGKKDMIMSDRINKIDKIRQQHLVNLVNPVEESVLAEPSRTF